MAESTKFDAAKSARAVALLLCIAAFYFARDILIPAALAVLLTFILYPLVKLMQRYRVPRALAVAITVLIAGGFAVGVGTLVIRQAADLSSKLPDYSDNLRAKVMAVKSSFNGKVSRLSGTISDLKQELASTQPATLPAAATARPGTSITNPLKVEVIDTGPAWTDLASEFAAPLLYPFAEAGITLLLLIFLLLHCEDIRERLIWLAGRRQMSLTTSAIDEAGERISRYLRMQLTVNVIYGILVTIGLSVIGVPNAILWGVMSTLLRFAPFLGPWLATSLPTLLAIAVFPNWTKPLLVVSMFVSVELMTNMILEPWLYSASTGISTLGVAVATVFWAWLWGPVGLILAVPITVCMVVLGKNMPMFSYLHQLFGTDEAVPEVARLYQRLLVGDEIAAEKIVTDRLHAEPFVQVCDQLLLPVLTELKRDMTGRLITHSQAIETIHILESTYPSDAAAPVHPKLLCVAGGNEIDGAAARLLAEVAKSKSIPAEAMSAAALAGEVVSHVQEAGISCVCIVQVAPIVSSHARHIIKMLTARFGEEVQLIRMIVGDAQQKDRLAANSPLRCECEASRLLEQLGELRVQPSISEPVLS